MLKLSSMLLGCTLLLGAGCATGGGSSGSNSAPGAKERLVSTRTTGATWDHILAGAATVTDVKQSCKEGALSMYVATSAICPGTKPAGAKDVSHQHQFKLAEGEHLCAAIGGGQGPCTLMYQLGGEPAATAAAAAH